MKKSRIVLSALAFVFAIAGAFATVLVQQGYYDANGTTAFGGTLDNITDPVGDTPTCLITNTGNICTISGEWAFNSAANAEANQGRQTNPSATGLLKKP